MEDDGLVGAAATAIVQELMKAETQAPERRGAIVGSKASQRAPQSVESLPHK